MDNEELDGVKFSEFPSQTPVNADEVVGLHSGDNARFSIANIVAAVRNGLASIFVPLTRTINSKALSTDIALDSSDIDYDNTGSGLTATDVQEAIDEVQDEIDNLPAPPSPSDATPQALGTAAAGSSSDYSRADHVHEKPTYSASDVGLGNVDNVQQYSASNPPPYPVTSVNGNTGAVTVSVPSAYTSNPEMDGTASPGSSGAWAKGDHVHPHDTSKQDTLTFDATPTASSTNPVQSGGVYDALGSKLNKEAVSIGSSNDLNNIVEPGWYKCTTAPANAPSGNFLNAWFEVVVNGSNILQFAYSNPGTSTGPTPKVRLRLNGVWGDWGSFDKNYPYANQSQLAYVETGSTASQNYTAGQYISLNGLLYTADTAIASGATFYTSGGNKNLTECVGGGFNNQLKVKEFTFTTATLGTSFSQTSRSIGTTQDLFGIDATHICSMQMRDNTLSPSSCIILGLWRGSLWIAATQSCTLSNSWPVKIVVTYY